MNGRESFDDALDRAIDALSRGEHLEAVLARHARHADALRPLLETALQARREAPAATAAMSPRLADHFSIVRAAVQRAQMTAQPLPVRGSGQQPPWWRRRLTVAPLSLPAGAFALLVFAGVSGAAAASIAVTGDTGVPSAVVSLVKQPQHWLAGGGEGSSHSSGAANANGHTPAAGSSSATVTPDSANRPVLMTLEGTVSDLHGNVFTLTTEDGTYEVNVDGTTKISGSLADGARTTVSGDVTAQKNMHADTVTVTSQSDTYQTPGTKNDHTPGQSDGHTPAPPADRTPEPPADRTPPGQGQSPIGGAGGAKP